MSLGGRAGQQGVGVGTSAVGCIVNTDKMVRLEFEHVFLESCWI